MDTDKLRRYLEARREEDPYDLLGWSFVSTRHKYLWVILPKNACVTTTTALRELEGNPYQQGGDLWNDEGVQKLRDFSVDETIEMLTSPDWFRFCFVRNPYERLLSAYKSKIGNGDRDPWYEHIKSEIRKFLGYEDVEGERARLVSFRDFVRYVREAHPFDGHWCLQTGRLAREIIPYDFIGRFETFQDDIGKVLGRFDARPDVIASAQTVRGQTARTHLPIAYDNALADEVYAFYEEDFEAFGYSRDSWMYQ